MARRIKIKVANKMRRKFAGEQPWSPKYKKYSQAIELWRRMVRLKKKVNTSRKALKKISKSLELPWIIVSATSLQGFKKKLKEAYKRYNKKKKEFKKDRNKFNNSLIDALAEEESKRSKLEISDLKKRIELQIKRENKSRRVGKKAESIRGKGNKDPVLRAIATDKNGNNYECNCQQTMIPVIAKSNFDRQQQCIGTPFMMTPLLE